MENYLNVVKFTTIVYKMTTIIKSGFEKILALFYEDKAANLHLRDIARKAGLNENSASRFLKMLENSNILASRKDGNLKKFRLKNNDIVYSIMALKDLERLNKLPPIRKNCILYFLQALEEKPIIALLFGSTAKNTYREDSDIDLLLIVNQIINTKKAEEYSEALTTITLKPMQIPITELKDELKLKNDKVIQSAINSGYPVTNHIEYYRMICNEGI